MLSRFTRVLAPKTLRSLPCRLFSDLSSLEEEEISKEAIMLAQFKDFNQDLNSIATSSQFL